MANIRLGYNFDTWDAASITSSSDASAGLAGANVVDDFVGKPWRTAVDADVNLVFDLGGATKLTEIGIFAFNLTSAATVQVQANNADAWGAPPLADTIPIVTDADGEVIEILMWFGDETYQYWRIRIQDAANPDTYIEIGRIAGCEYWTPTRGIGDGFQYIPDDPSEGSPAPGRQDYYRERKRFRKVAVTFSAMGRTDREKWEAVFSKVGKSHPVILSLDATNYPTKDSMYCYIQTPLTFAHRILEFYNLGTIVFGEVTE